MSKERSFAYNKSTLKGETTRKFEWEKITIQTTYVIHTQHNIKMPKVKTTNDVHGTAT